MVDFKIRRGLSTTLFSSPGIVNPRLVIEEGCWYLCTDTAELFLGVLEDNTLVLKKINQSDAVNRPSSTPSTGEGEADRGVIGAYIDEEKGELYLVFSDNTEESLGIVVGSSGKDGLVTSIKIGETTYEHTNGVIELPEFVTTSYIDAQIGGLATKEFVEDAIADIDIPQLDLNNYATKEDIEHFASVEYVDKKVAAIENPALNITILYGGDANPEDDEA